MAALSRTVTSIESGGADAAMMLASQEDVAETLLALSSYELERMWQALTPVATEALATAAPAMQGAASPRADPAPAENGATERALHTLHAVALLAHASISDAKREAPEELVELATELHDIIFDLTDPRASELQNAIVELCEAWWLGGRAGRDELVPQTISYLLVRALHELATSADVKRLYAFRSAFGVLDYSDDSVAPLKRLLLHCAIRPNVLRCAEGLAIPKLAPQPPHSASAWPTHVARAHGRTESSLTARHPPLSPCIDRPQARRLLLRAACATHRRAPPRDQGTGAFVPQVAARAVRRGVFSRVAQREWHLLAEDRGGVLARPHVPCGARVVDEHGDRTPSAAAVSASSPLPMTASASPSTFRATATLVQVHARPEATAWRRRVARALVGADLVALVARGQSERAQERRDDLRRGLPAAGPQAARRRARCATSDAVRLSTAPPPRRCRICTRRCYARRMPHPRIVLGAHPADHCQGFAHGRRP